MVSNEIKSLRNQLEHEVTNNFPYDKIYETSVKIDKLIIKYYKDHGLTKDV